MIATIISMVLLSLIACYCCTKNRGNNYLNRIYSYDSIEEISDFK